MPSSLTQEARRKLLEVGCGKDSLKHELYYCTRQKKKKWKSSQKNRARKISGLKEGWS